MANHPCCVCILASEWVWVHLEAAPCEDVVIIPVIIAIILAQPTQEWALIYILWQWQRFRVRLAAWLSVSSAASALLPLNFHLGKSPYSLEFMCIPHGACKPGFWGCFSDFFYFPFPVACFLLCFCFYRFSLVQQLARKREPKRERERRVKTQMIYWTDSQQWILSSQVAGQRSSIVVFWMRHRWVKGILRALARAHPMPHFSLHKEKYIFMTENR